jgi:hypothetical protein
MDIRFISSLTVDDENRIAAHVLQLVANLLDQLPIAYSVRIENGAKVFEHSHMSETAGESPQGRPVGPGESGRFVNQASHR